MLMLLYSVLLQAGQTGEMADLDLSAKCACETDRVAKVFLDGSVEPANLTEQLPAN